MRKFFTLFVLSAMFLAMNAQDKIKVLYCTKDKSEAITANGGGADPLLTMMQADDRLEVTVLTDASVAVPSESVAAADVVVLTEAPGSGDAMVASLEGIDKPFFCMKYYAYKSSVWDWGSPGEGATVNIEVVDGQESHPIFKDVTITDGKVATVKTLTDDSGAAGTKGNNYGHTLKDVTGDVLRLAYPEGAAEADAVSIQAVDDPTASVGGTTIPKRYVCIGLNYGAQCASNAENLTDDGMKILKNGYEWTFGIEDEVQGINKNYVSNAKIYGLNDAIRVVSDSPVAVEVYSIDGKLVNSVNLNGTANIASQEGLYIVKMNNVVKKVYVK